MGEFGQQSPAGSGSRSPVNLNVEPPVVQLDEDPSGEGRFVGGVPNTPYGEQAADSDTEAAVVAADSTEQTLHAQHGVLHAAGVGADIYAAGQQEIYDSMQVGTPPRGSSRGNTGGTPPLAPHGGAPATVMHSDAALDEGAMPVMVLPPPAPAGVDGVLPAQAGAQGSVLHHAHGVVSTTDHTLGGLGAPAGEGSAYSSSLPLHAGGVSSSAVPPGGALVLPTADPSEEVLFTPPGRAGRGRLPDVVEAIEPVETRSSRRSVAGGGFDCCGPRGRGGDR